MNIDSLVMSSTGVPNTSAAVSVLPPERSAFAEQPINILIVDDDPKNLVVLETVLENPLYRLVRAESADQALLALVSEEFALLILDIRMPDMTGLELAQMIKERKRTARIPIIFLTAYYNEDQHVLDGYDSGAVDYLHKPVNASILRSKVAVFADLHRKSQELEHANGALLAEVSERRRAQDQLLQLNETLERRVMERTHALHASDARLRLATDAVQLGIWSWQPEADRFAWENDWGYESLGIARDRGAVSSAEFASEFVVAEDLETFGLAFKAAAQRMGPLSFEGRLQPKVGALRWVELVGKPMCGPDGGSLRFLGTARDVTERKQAEEALREADARKDVFLATLAHELRNPLAPIRTAAYVLESPTLTPSALGSSREIIARQVRHMASLLDDLLDISRVSRGKFELKRRPVDLAKILDEAIESAQPLITSKSHALAFTPPSGRLRLDADPVRLTQVMTNLLTNAAKYTDAGGKITLSVELQATELVLCVRDNGVGIPPAMLSRIFEMFTQGNDSTQGSGGGLGIGLALAKGIVELHGGHVEARSAGHGQGSEFCVHLPRSALLTTGGHEEEPAAGQRPPSSRRRVLVADDNRDAAASLALLLELAGHQVYYAYSGLDALALALREQPDTIVLDIAMPGMSGYEVADRIGQQAWRASATLIAITGFGQERDKLRALAAGFDHHLTKPVDPAQIEALLLG